MVSTKRGFQLQPGSGLIWNNYSSNGTRGISSFPGIRPVEEKFLKLMIKKSVFAIFQTCIPMKDMDFRFSHPAEFVPGDLDPCGGDYDIFLFAKANDVPVHVFRDLFHILEYTFVHNFVSP